MFKLLTFISWPTKRHSYKLWRKSRNLYEWILPSIWVELLKWKRKSRKKTLSCFCNQAKISDGWKDGWWFVRGVGLDGLWKKNMCLFFLIYIKKWMILIKLLITNCDINRFIIKIKKAASASSAAAAGANVINKIVVVAVIVFVFVIIPIQKNL